MADEVIIGKEIPKVSNVLKKKKTFRVYDLSSVCEKIVLC